MKIRINPAPGFNTLVPNFLFKYTISTQGRVVPLKLNIGYYGTSVLNPGAGFLRIFTVAFDRLGYVS